MSTIPSFTGLQTSLRALLAQQAALDTTGHNIANTNTVGYTRQEAVLTASTSLTLGSSAVQNGSGAQLGQGVDVEQYRRQRDSFGDLQYRAATMSAGQQSTTSQVLGASEDLLSEPSDSGINKLFSNFYDAFTKLSTDPTNTAAKAAVAGAASNLTSALKSLSNGMTSLATQTTQQLAALTGTGGPVQQAGAELAQLNQGISQATAAGRTPNDLLDRRDTLLDQLSQYGSVSLTPGTNGSVDVALDGQNIVTGSTFAWPASYTATSGQLGALTTVANTTIPGYVSDLDGVAAKLASSVNAISPGFFTGTTATTITGPAASAVSAGSGGAGDNSTALAIAALRGSANDANGLYASLVSKMGSDVASAGAQATTAQALQSAADDRRQSVNGVSLDEEMTNLVRFQRGYQAASRSFSTQDEMLDTLINRTGKVGL